MIYTVINIVFAIIVVGLTIFFVISILQAIADFARSLRK